MDGAVTIASDDSLAISLQLTAGSTAGIPVEMLITAQAGSATFYFDAISWGWLPGEGITYSGAIVDVPEFELFSIANSPVGTYDFNFDLQYDISHDGTKESTSDTVRVTVVE
jgi:hypothetical protein